jgi:outer membrane lipoprotein
MRQFPLLVLLLILTACASTPVFDTAGVNRSLTPKGVTADPQSATGKKVQWGGVILGIANRQDSTVLEVLAYPLDGKARPQRDRAPQGRFFLHESGFLDPATYGEGRLITAVGTVTHTQPGKVGEAPYSYPVITARQLYLWAPDETRSETSTFFNIGVGGGSGNWGSGVGVGVGF